MNVAGARYRLLKRLAVGGMAEIFLASLVGEAGFERPVILKKILPGLAGDPDFVRRLVDEGLLAARLNHANIVQILDLGRLGPDYFIAMEYVEGPDLRDVLQRARSKGFLIPVPIATHILWQVARGLAYAHEKRDNRGAPLGIVHRDVSPANVLLSWEGQVKITDFGIAKANRRLTVTLPGILQGKFPYMSPEQGEGEELDCRSDVFSYGTVAYELLTLKRPFEGASDLKTLEAIRRAPYTPLEELRPGLPTGLQEILAVCLEKDRESRFASAGELERALGQLMRTEGWVVTDADVADFLQMLYGSEAAQAVVGEEMTAPTVLPSTPLQPEELVNVQWGIPTTPPKDATRSVRVQDWRGWRRRRWLGWAGVALALVLLLVGGLVVWGPWSDGSPEDLRGVSGEASVVSPPAVPPSAEPVAEVEKGKEPEREVKGPSASKEEAKQTEAKAVHGSDACEQPEADDGYPLTRRPLPHSHPSGGDPHGAKRLVDAWLAGWPTHTVDWKAWAARHKSQDGSRSPAAAEEKPTSTQIVVFPAEAQLYVNDEPLGPAPAWVTISPGQTKRVRIEALGYKTEQFVLTFPGPRKIHKDLAAAFTGRLALRYFPANATLTIDGKAVAGQNGLNIVEMELPVGSYTVVLRHADRETVKTIVIEKDREWRGTMTVEP